MYNMYWLLHAYVYVNMSLMLQIKLSSCLRTPHRIQMKSLFTEQEGMLLCMLAFCRTGMNGNPCERTLSVAMHNAISTWLSGCSSLGLSDADIASINSILAEQVEANMGMAMIYALVSAAQDWLQEKVQRSCCFQQLADCAGR